MPTIARRLWCSCTIIDYLEGKPRAKDCELIIEQAKRRELEIVVSVVAMGEVAKIEGVADAEAEAKISQFFREYYVVPAAYDILVAEKVRDLIRRYKGLKPFDAAHVATALQHSIPVLETFDDPLINLVGNKEPGLVIRHPLYEGARPLPGISGST